MGSIRAMNPVKLFAAVLVSDPGLAAETERRLVSEFGPVDHRSPLLPFDFTDYYEQEMGSVIDRVLFSFANLTGADRLAGIKRRTNEIEEEMKPLFVSVVRPVNIDPGYIEQAKVILASTKNFYHRIHLGMGIFGEVTMHFKNNTYQFFPWTYPDYKSRDYQEFFIRARQIYRTQLRSVCILNRDERQGA